MVVDDSDCYFLGQRVLRHLPKKYRDAFPLDKPDDMNRRRSDRNDLSDEMFLKKHGFPKRAPIFRNIEMLQYFISSLPKKAIKFFAGMSHHDFADLGLSNSCMSRAKLADNTQRNTAVNVTDTMSDIFLELLSYEEPRKSGFTMDAHFYWYCSMNYIQSVLVGGILLYELSDM